MPSVLHILHSYIIGLQYILLLMCIGNVPIVTILSVNMTGSRVKRTALSVLHILRWSIIGLWCFFLLIRIRAIPILAFIPFDITRSQVKSLELSRGPSSPACGGEGITLVAFVTFIFGFPAAPWHPEMQFIMHAMVGWRDIGVSASDLRLRKHHLGGQIVKQNGIVNRRKFHTVDHGRRGVRSLLDLTLYCTKSVCCTVC